MTNSITYYSELLVPGILGGKVQMSSPVVLPTESIKRSIMIQCTQVQISDRIPNIFNGYPYGVAMDNTMLRVGTDTVAYVTILLPMGLYLDASMLNAAINAAINTLGWWTNPLDPGFTISANSVIDRFNITIDSTKLNALYGTQFKVDFRKSTTGSDFYYLIGFPDTTELTVDGVYTSPNLPQMETQGTACMIELDLMPSRRFGDYERKVAAEVSFAGKTSPSDSIWPQGAQVSPTFVYPGNRLIRSYTVDVRTRKGQPMIFMGGILTFTIVFL